MAQKVLGAQLEGAHSCSVRGAQSLAPLTIGDVRERILPVSTMQRKMKCSETHYLFHKNRHLLSPPLQTLSHSGKFCVGSNGSSGRKSMKSQPFSKFLSLKRWPLRRNLAQGKCCEEKPTWCISGKSTAHLGPVEERLSYLEKPKAQGWGPGLEH